MKSEALSFVFIFFFFHAICGLSTNKKKEITNIDFHDFSLTMSTLFQVLKLMFIFSRDRTNHIGHNKAVVVIQANGKKTNNFEEPRF